MSWFKSRDRLTCGDGFHTYHGNRRKCDCGARKSPAHRNIIQRFNDKRQLKRIQQQRRNGTRPT